MTTLNYHHLRYFWTVAHAGGLRRAAEQLAVSPPSISAQVRELEGAVGAKLFRRRGRDNVLTDAGQVALRYADEIFALGRELTEALQREVAAQPLRMHVGVTDSFPKLVTQQVLTPVFALPRPVHVIFREGKVDDLVAQLVAQRLDVVLADEPPPGGLKVRVASHTLGECGVTFCATARLAGRLRAGFPRSLHQEPALFPAENTGLRRALAGWLQGQGIEPRIVAEFEDVALMKVMATDGRGFVPVPSVVATEAVDRFALRIVGETRKCRMQFFALTLDRSLQHPAVASLVQGRVGLAASR